MGSSLLEGVGISLIYPILKNSQTIPNNIPFPLNHLLEAFAGINVNDRLLFIVVSLIFVICSKNLLLFLVIILNSKLQILSQEHFQITCFKQLTKVGLGYFNSKKGGEFQTICVNHAQTLGVFVNTTGNILPKFFNVLVYITMMIMLSWKLTVLSIGLATISTLILRKIMENTESIGKELAKRMSLLNSLFLEFLQAMKIIRLFGREKETINSYQKSLNHYNKSVFQMSILRGSIAPLYESSGIIGLGIILIVGLIYSFDEQSTGLPAMILFLVIFQRISTSVLAINQYRVSVLGDLPAYRRVFRFLASDDKQYLDNGLLPFTHLENAIEFNNVKFSYNTEGSLILNDVSYSVPKGFKVGIAGASGAGKSTLIELLLRFYDPQGGQILIDGIDLKEIDIDVWRKKIGVVSQDIFLFNDTLKNNIAYGKFDATQSEIEAAAHNSHAHEFIQALPQGFDTLVGDRGVLLSGGQKQRIAIARAILIDPEILIFDEATSALDTESEKLVQQALREVGKGRTVITIAHRLSTIFGSDKIIVMESGKIVEEGTDKELSQKEGTYKKLLRMQGVENYDINKTHFVE